MIASKRNWIDVTHDELNGKVDYNEILRLIELVGYEIIRHQEVDKTLKSLNFNRTLKKFSKLRISLQKVSSAISEIDENTQWLFSSWITEVLQSSERPEHLDTSFPEVTNSLNSLDMKIEKWSRGIEIMCQNLEGHEQFRGKGRLGSLPQYIFAYRVRCIYKELFDLPNLPDASDLSFDKILHQLMFDLELDTNMSRVYKRSTPKRA